VDSNAYEGIRIVSYYSDNSDVRVTSSYIRHNGMGYGQHDGLYAYGGSTFRELSNNHIMYNDGDGVYSKFGVYPHTFVGNTIAANSGDGIFVVTNTVPPKDVIIAGNFVRNNGKDGIVSSGAHFTSNILEGNRYPISVTGRLGNYYQDQNGDDENAFINNTFNNALGLRPEIALSDTLSYDFPDSIDSHVYVAVDNDPHIDDGDTMTIEPAVTVKMNPHIRLYTNGTLISAGQPDSSIVFTSYRDSSFGGKTNLVADTTGPAPGDWDDIQVNSSANESQLVYTKMLYGGDNGQILDLNNVSLDSSMKHLLVRHSSRIGIQFDHGDGILEACRVDSNAWNGVRITSYYSDNSHVRVRHSYIVHNGLRHSGDAGLWANYGSGFPEVSNSHIMYNDGTGLYTRFPDEIPQTFVDNTITNNGGDGIFAAMKSNNIDSLLTITGNTITDNSHEGIVSSRAIIKQNTLSGNRYPIAVTAQISDSGTVNESGNVYADNNIEGNTYDHTMAIRGDEDVEGTLGGAYPDSITSNTYVVIHDTHIASGTRFDIVPGTNLKFPANTRLRVEGNIQAMGTHDDRVVFTSWKDDTFGGDTNEDTTATSAGPGDWEGVYVRDSGSDDSHFRNAVIRFGGHSGENLSLYKTAAQVDSSFITFSSGSGIYTYQCSPTFYGLELHNNRRGLYTDAGYNNLVPEIHQSNIYHNTDYGVYNTTPNDTVNALMNYWGAATGPYHPDLNPSGQGNPVSDGVKFEPWLNSAQGPLIGDVSLNGDITAFDASLVLRHDVHAITLTGDSLAAAEVSANGTVTAYDASLILQYVAGIIVTFPALGKPVPPAVLAQAISMKDVEGNAGETVRIPITVSRGIDINSVDLAFSYDMDMIRSVEIEQTDASDDMMLQTRTTGDTMRVAMAGAHPAGTDDPVLNIVLHLQDNVSDQIDGSLHFIQFNVNDVDLTSRITGVDVNVKGKPSAYKLVQNYPNPFNPTTTLKYELPEKSQVSLAIYNLRGQRIAILVRNKVQKAGYYDLTWDGRNQFGQPVSSGVYIYRITAQSKSGSGKHYSKVKKMTLLR